MARKAGPFPDSPFYEVENRRLQRAFNSATGFVKTGQGQVTAGTGAELVIAAYPDGALIDGLYVENPDPEPWPITTNSGNTNPRIDRLVLRLDMTAKTITPYQIVGTPAASPIVPPLVKTDTVVDMPLCRYTMPGSASAQNPGNIVDERGTIDRSVQIVTTEATTVTTGGQLTNGPRGIHPAITLTRWFPFNVKVTAVVSLVIQANSQAALGAVGDPTGTSRFGRKENRSSSAEQNSVTAVDVITAGVDSATGMYTATFIPVLRAEVGSVDATVPVARSSYSIAEIIPKAS